MQLIKEDAERVKRKVDKYRNEVNSKVNSYRESMKSKNDQLEKVTTTVKNLLEYGNVAEQIRQKEAITSKHTKAMRLNLDELKLTARPALTTKGTSGDRIVNLLWLRLIISEDELVELL